MLRVLTYRGYRYWWVILAGVFLLISAGGGE
jgi:hypothetical protein